MFSQKFIFISIFEYPLRIISELIKIPVDTLIKYYTDGHDVDEDVLTISAQGDYWADEFLVGIARRYIRDAPTASNASDTVASYQSTSLMNSAFIRMFMMSTKILGLLLIPVVIGS